MHFDFLPNSAHRQGEVQDFEGDLAHIQGWMAKSQKAAQAPAEVRKRDLDPETPEGHAVAPVIWSY